MYEAAGTACACTPLRPTLSQTRLTTTLGQGWPRIEGSDRCYGAPICTVECKTRLSESQVDTSKSPVSVSQADDVGPSLVLVSRSEIFRLLVRDLGTNRDA